MCMAPSGYRQACTSVHESPPSPVRSQPTPFAACDQVLSEIEDIVDLPYRADRCWEMLEADEANLVPAFEALVLLTGTAENAKQAWQRSVWRPGRGYRF